MHRLKWQRSIVVEVLILFLIILTVLMAAGYTVYRNTQVLVADARDSVWEASVPPRHVFNTVNAQWLIHYAVLDAGTRGGDIQKTLETVQQLEAQADAYWGELTSFVPYFPDEAKVVIDETSRLLGIFKASYWHTLKLVQTGQRMDARAHYLDVGVPAMTAYARQTAIMLDYMRSRIDSVNLRMEATGAKGITQFNWLAAAMVGIMLFSALAVIFRLARPLARLNAAMASLAQGDLSVTVPELRSRNEIGRMSRTVSQFKAALIERQELLRVKADEQEAARITQLRRERTQVSHELAATFEASVAGVADTVSIAASQLEKAAEALASRSESVTGRVARVSESSERTVVLVQQLAAETVGMAQNMSAISERIGTSSTGVRAVVADVRQTSKNIEALNDTTGSIGSVVNQISDIATQTNLLALNATIEAARAGAAGKGFSVVAGEVKQLATQTAKATSDISQKIQAIQTATIAAAGSINLICSQFASVSDQGEEMRDAIGRQMQSARTISESLNSAVLKALDTADSFSEVARDMADSRAIVEGLLVAARDLARTGTSLRTEVSTFLGTIRAA